MPDPYKPLMREISTFCKIKELLTEIDIPSPYKEGLVALVIVLLLIVREEEFRMLMDPYRLFEKKQLERVAVE